MTDEKTATEERPAIYPYRFLTHEEVKAKVLEELRKAEASHIAAITQAELNRQNAKLLREEAGTGKLRDQAKQHQATMLMSQVKKLEREATAHEAAIVALTERFAGVLELELEDEEL